MKTRTLVLVVCAAGVVAGAALGVVGALWGFGPFAAVTAISAGPALGLDPHITTTPMRWYVEVGRESSALTTAGPLALAPPPEFDATAALADVRAIASFGPRKGGSEAESKVADYLRDRLKAIGLRPTTESFPLSDGTTSRNVIARIEGSSDTVLVLGAHYDSKPPSPGANDNASGCAVLLQIAEVLQGHPVVPTVEFVFYGAEEKIDSNADHHHYGSRYRVKQMTAAERTATAGMISVDMIGFGSQLNSLTMGAGPQTLSDSLLAYAKREGIALGYRKDRASSGSSDHEAYERAGIPAACVSARTDPTYHTADDVAAHVSTARMATAGRLVLGYVWSLDSTALAALKNQP